MDREGRSRSLWRRVPGLRRTEAGGIAASYRLVLFDLDDTLTDSANGGVGDATVKWLPGRVARLRRLRADGVHVAIATNQGGVGLGYNTEAETMRAINRVAAVVQPPLRVYAAFGHPRAKVAGYPRDDPWRKPRPGMILQAMQDFGVAPQETLFVGDRDTDRAAAAAAGVAYLDAKEYFAMELDERTVA
jgi:D-glycero-D-manno-heptose 1,7-bisphosphate phosphatase